ncbi:PCI domain-containing protein [Entamoeba marina]
MSAEKERILLELARDNKVVFYDILLKKLGVKTMAEADEIIISAMKNKLFEGHIDHKQKCLFISSVRVDSVPKTEIPLMIRTLQALSAQCTEGKKTVL